MLTTAVANALSTITYPIRHEFTATSPNQADALDRFGDANTHILVTGLDERRFSSHNPAFDYGTLVGRIMPVRPSRPAGEQWYLSADDNDGNGAYLTGPQVNPTPVNGRLYQELRQMRGESNCSPFTLRYNDDLHLADRAERGTPWTIVWAQPGLEHQVGRARITAPYAWVEVRSPLTPVSTGLAGLATDADIDAIFSEEEVEVPIVPAPVEYVGNTATDHTLGMGHVETDGPHAGHVILNPEREVGQMYLTWYPSHNFYTDHVYMETYRGDDEWTVLGYFNRGVDGNVYYNDDAYSRPPRPVFDSVQQWAKLAWETSPVSDDSAVRLTTLTEEAEVSHEDFENLNDALNVLAREQSWCSEYERTMRGIGMRDRRSGGRIPFDMENLGTAAPIQRHAWDVSYDVDVTVRDDSASYRVQSMLESEYGLSSVSEVRFEATITVTVRGVVAEDEDSAEEMVTRSQIEDEVDNQIDGSFEINDYSHSDTNEDTDFDWDDFDE